MKQLLSLDKIRPGHTVLNGDGKIFKLSNEKRCPICGTPNFCYLHEYAYIVWWKNFLAGYDTHSAYVYDSYAEAARERAKRSGY